MEQKSWARPAIKCNWYKSESWRDANLATIVFLKSAEHIRATSGRWCRNQWWKYPRRIAVRLDERDTPGATWRVELKSTLLRAIKRMRRQSQNGAIFLDNTFATLQQSPQSLLLCLRYSKEDAGLINTHTKSWHFHDGNIIYFISFFKKEMCHSSSESIDGCCRMCAVSLMTLLINWSGHHLYHAAFKSVSNHSSSIHSWETEPN